MYNNLTRLARSGLLSSWRMAAVVSEGNNVIISWMNYTLTRLASSGSLSSWRMAVTMGVEMFLEALMISLILHTREMLSKAMRTVHNAITHVYFLFLNKKAQRDQMADFL